MCKAFDADGKGYVRSETVGCVFLQRKADARRIYATVVHAKANVDGFKNEGITFPGGHAQEILLREVYAEAKVDPTTVQFVEAHGTGTKVCMKQAFCRSYFRLNCQRSQVYSSRLYLLLFYY